MMPTDDDIFELAYESTELIIRFGTLDFSFYMSLKDKLIFILENNPDMQESDKEKIKQNINRLNDCLEHLLKRGPS